MPRHPGRISETDAQGPANQPEGAMNRSPPNLILRKRAAETEDSRNPLGKRTRLDLSVPSLSRQVSSNSQDLPSSPPVGSGSGNIPGGSPSVVYGTTDSGSMTEAYTQAEHDLVQRRADLSKFRHQRLESAIIEASEGLKAKHYEWMKTPIIVLIRPLLDYVTTHEDRFDSQVHGIDIRMRIMDDNIKVLRSDVTDLRAEVTDLRSDVTDLRSEVTELRLEVTELRSEFTVLGKRVTKLEDRVTELGSEVKELSSEVKKHRIESNDRFKQLDDKLDTILGMMKANLDRST